MDVNEVLQFFAWLEKRNSLGRHFHLRAGLRIAADPASALPRTKATKTANLNLVVLLQRLDNAFKHCLDNRFRLFAWQLRYADNFLDQIRLRHCTLCCLRLTGSACHGPTALPLNKNLGLDAGLSLLPMPRDHPLLQSAGHLAALPYHQWAHNVNPFLRTTPESYG